MTGATKIRPKGNGFAITITAIPIVIAFLLFCWTMEREANRELTDALETESHQKRRLTELKELDQIVRSKRNETLGMLRHCEVVDDIPKLGGGRIVSVVGNAKQLVLYVPKGKHTLEITCKYDFKSEAKKPTKSWSVPLVGDAGYVLRVGKDVETLSSFWELTSNNAAFATRREQLSEQAFSDGNMSWSGHETFDFPNRISSFVKPKFLSALKHSPTIRIYECERRINGVDARFPITASLRSENPPCVLSRHHFQLSGIGQESLALPYAGNGVYLLKRPESE